MKHFEADFLASMGIWWACCNKEVFSPKNDYMTERRLIFEISSA